MKVYFQFLTERSNYLRQQSCRKHNCNSRVALLNIGALVKLLLLAVAVTINYWS